MRAMRILAAVICLAGAPVPAFTQDQPSEAVRAIAHLHGDLYTVRDGQQATVFLVTPDGIILADPLSLNTARWLRQEFATRFPGLDVKYVLLTHHRFDRAAGAGVFDGTAELVGHSDFDSAVKKARSAKPDLYRNVIGVESTYSSRRTITLGGKRVELVHAGNADAPALTVLLFVPERVVFAVDAPRVTVAPFSFESFTPKEVRSWLRIVAPLGFDTLLSGHGETTRAAEIVTLERYIDDLVAGVVKGYESGRSLENLQANSFLDGHRGGSHYPQRHAHIAHVYNTMGLMTTEIYGAALMNQVSPNSDYCTSYVTCVPARGTTRAATMGAMFSRGRIGVAAELRVGDQFSASRTSQLHDDEFAHRDTVFSVLFRFSPVPRGPIRIAVLAGPTIISGDTRGMSFVRTVGAVPIAFKSSDHGITAGADVRVSLGGRLSLVLPFTVTEIKRESDRLWRRDLHAGVGLAVKVFRHLR